MGRKVLILIQHLANGGAERVVPLWAQMLTNAGYTVTVLTYYPAPNEYPLDPRVTRAYLAASFEQYSQFRDRRVVCKKLLEEYLAQHPQDLILPHLESPNIISALCDSKHEIITQTILNSPWDKEYGLNLILQDWSIQRRGSVILQNTEQMEYFNTPEFAHVKKYVVHNPLNPAITEIKKDTYGKIKKIVAVGRLVSQKNHALMIEAIRILRDEFHENYYLDIYGVGELQETLQTQIDQAKLSDQVKLCGRSDDIFHVLINYDLFLIASAYEGMPNSLLEAMGLGVPSLAIKCRTGITELINDGKNGYILDSYNAHDLATKIHAINNPTQLERIGKQARTDMTRYATENIQAELVAVVQDLLDNPPPITAAPLPPIPNITDYYHYFENSLRVIKMANYTIGQQLFDHARNTLQNAKISTINATQKIYLCCLRFNRFDIFYEFLQTKLNKIWTVSCGFIVYQL